MSRELGKQYNPRENEDKWYSHWEKEGLFSARPSPHKPPYCIVIPPPNVTGILHMGHALNDTLQDILIRYKKMRGFEALWMPGTDHAGIATQNVVEKSLAKEGLKRQDLGREKFVERVWEWRQLYGSTIINQLKKLGCACDWGRTRFTMDQEYSLAVTEVFVRLYEKKLIYQGDYIINWCPRCQTALSDEEASHQEIEGSLYYLKYPLQDAPQEFLTVATTRPETMLGDTAVAVNPKDKRYQKYIGRYLILPLINRPLKVIADEMVDMEFGTGAVKVTPAHDPNDYNLGKKHSLEFINVMTPDGRMNEAAQKFKGLDRFKAREAVIEEMKSQGLLEKITPHTLSAGHCYRCNTIVEPYLSKQWFVRMKPLSGPAIKAVKKGKVKFHPERWTKVYLNWMENIQDWCISRQIWWGHRMPVYYCSACQAKDPKKGIIVSRTKPLKCPRCSSTELKQEEDVLDTWFSSWLWPFATFYWPFSSSCQPSAVSLQPKEKKEHEIKIKQRKADLKYFYPTATLTTASEIIFFWVARMIMAGFEFTGKIPFKDIYIHGTVRDSQGKKMSKSLGNAIDPLKIISEYGTDALRFSLVFGAQGQDLYLSREKFEQGRNFANKIWNASRFVIMNLGADFTAETTKGAAYRDLDTVNRWILSRFYSTLEKVNRELEGFRFNEAANSIYSFFWHEFCDWYLELVKPQIAQKDTRAVMYEVLEKTLRLIHPFMPFISEEIWQRLKPETGISILKQEWPRLEKKFIDRKVEAEMEELFNVINSIRNMRAEMEINPASQVDIRLACNDTKLIRELEPLSSCIKNLAKVGNLGFGEKYQAGKNQYAVVSKNMQIVMPLEGFTDIQQQIEKTNAKIEKLSSEIINKEKMLGNADFTARAPKEIVENERTKLCGMKEQLKKLEAIKNGLR